MIKTRVLDTYRGKMKIKYDDGTEPSIIGIRTLCEHADKCPSLAYLSKQQLKLWQASILFLLCLIISNDFCRDILLSSKTFKSITNK